MTQAPTELCELNLLPYQYEYLTDPYGFKLLHGGRGSGKTRTLATSIYNKACQYPGARYCVVCNDHVQLRDSTLEALFEYLDEIKCRFIYKRMDKILTFPNGTAVSMLTFEKDKTSLKGSEWDAAFVDEADGKNTTEEKFDYLIDGVRGKNGDRSVTVCCNPVPPGHFLAKRFFIDPRPDHKGYKVSTYMNRKNLPEGYIPRLEAKYPPGSDDHKRWMLGELVTLAGAIYKMFGPHLIVKPEDVPKNAKLYIYGQDLGVLDPHVMLEGRMSTNGILYITREYYVAGLDIIEHLPALKNMYRPGAPVFSDHSATQHSIMRREGFSMVNAMKDVQPGIQMVSHRMLMKGIRISTRCHTLIQELYNYCWRDLPNSAREEPEHKFSHAPDALRYMIAGLDGQNITDGL